MSVFLTLLLGPGIGQFYNRHFKKGAVILAIGFGLLVIFFVKMFKELVPLLPQPVTLPIDQEMVRNISLQIMRKNTVFFDMVKIVFAVIWSYSLVDAYFGAKKHVQNERK